MSPSLYTLLVGVSVLLGPAASASGQAAAPAPPAGAAPALAPAQSPATAAERTTWGWWLRPHDAPIAIARLHLPLRSECCDAALATYQAAVERVATEVEASRTADLAILEQDYVNYLATNPEANGSMTEKELEVIKAARKRLADGTEATCSSDPFCLQRYRVIWQRSGHLLFGGEAAARSALVLALAACAEPPLEPRTQARMEMRLLLEAANRGGENMVNCGGLDPALVANFDMYVVLEGNMRSGAPLAALPTTTLSVKDLDPATAPPAAVKAQKAILEFDADVAQMNRTWLGLWTDCTPEASATEEAMLRAMKVEFEMMKQMIPRRWRLVTDLGAILRDAGQEPEASQWQLQAGKAMFPSAFESGLSDRFVATVGASGELPPGAVESVRKRFQAFEEARHAVRLRLIQALITGAGNLGYHDPNTEKQIAIIRSEIADLDLACVAELTAMVSQAK